MSERTGIVGLQRVIRLDVDAFGNSPLCAFVHGTNIEYGNWPPLFQPCSQGFNIDGVHHDAPFSLTTGRPNARQSGSPCASRRALYPLARNRVTASSAKTQ